MSDEVLVKVENVSKKFCRSLKKSLWYGIQDIASELTGRKYEHELRPDEFWAVNDVSFQVRRGECLGLIGPNGAGKSTLLKMLNGLIKPDKGRIEMRGRVAALIELQAGFNPILTGLENIYNRAAILGISKAEVDKQLDSILNFAEIHDFIYMPVQNYSSGMKVRLGFAVAAHLHPDVMIIDEVLAVGDIGFRAKCLEYISKVFKDAAVLFVSHSMPIINRYCDKVIAMKQGEIIAYGTPAKVIEEYYELFESEHGRASSLPGNELKEFILMNENNQETSEVEYGSSLHLKVKAIVDPEIRFPVIKILFLDRELQVAASCQSEPEQIINRDGFISLAVKIFPIILKPSQYKLSLVVRNEELSFPLITYEAYWGLKVTGGRQDFGGERIHFLGSWQNF